MYNMIFATLHYTFDGKGSPVDIMHAWPRTMWRIIEVMMSKDFSISKMDKPDLTKAHISEAKRRLHGVNFPIGADSGALRTFWEHHDSNKKRIFV